MVNPDLYVYRAKVTRIVDGDTLVMLVDLGMNVHTEHSIRVLDVNTPELFTGDDRERARQAMRDTDVWVSRVSAKRSRWPFLIRTKKDTQTFGRYLADVYDAATGESLADYLRTKGWT